MPANRHAELLRQYLEDESRRPGSGPPRPWSEWLRVTLGASVALGTMLTLADCGGVAEEREGPDGGGCPDCTGGTAGTGGAPGVGGSDGGGVGDAYGVPFEICMDGIDNDYDGLVDCNDPDCLVGVPCGVLYGVPGPRCGDGVIDASRPDGTLEQCDDGNSLPGDGCSATCTVEPGFVCAVPGSPCAPATSACPAGLARCGDACVNWISDVANCGACGAACVAGEACAAGVCVAPTPAICGNGAVDPGEECDDGVNTGAYGTCAPDCRLGPRCGDGIVQPAYEQCDGAAGPSLPAGCCSPSCAIYTTIACAPDGG